MSIYYNPGSEGLTDPTHHLKAALEAVAATARKLKEERDEARAQLEIIKPIENNPVAEFFSSPNTPETDAAERMAFAQEYMVPTEFARRLERERDEARQRAAKLAAQLLTEMEGAK